MQFAIGLMEGNKIVVFILLSAQYIGAVWKHHSYPFYSFPFGMDEMVLPFQISKIDKNG